MNEFLVFLKTNQSLIALCTVLVTIVFSLLTVRHNRKSRELQLKLNIFMNLAENIDSALYKLKHPIYVAINENIELPIEFFQSLTKVKMVLHLDSLEIVNRWENTYISIYFQMIELGYAIIDIKSEISAIDPIINNFENEIIFLQQKYYDAFVKGDMNATQRALEHKKAVSNLKKEYVDERLKLILKRCELEDIANIKLFELKGEMAKVNIDLLNAFRSELGLKSVKFNEAEHNKVINEWKDKLKDLIKLSKEAL